MSLIHKIKQDNNTKNNTVTITNGRIDTNSDIITNINTDNLVKDLANINPKRRQITMKLKEKNLKKVDQLSKKYNCSRQELIDLAIEKTYSPGKN
jgi:predicted P-loop ATPase